MGTPITLKSTPNPIPAAVEATMCVNPAEIHRRFPAVLPTAGMVVTIENPHPDHVAARPATIAKINAGGKSTAITFSPCREICLMRWA
jgi:hypothetical protein